MDSQLHSSNGVLQLNLLRELNSIRETKVIASSCVSFINVPIHLMDRCIHELSQKGLIIAEKKKFIGHTETLIQITQEGQRFIYNTPNPA